VSIQNSIKNSYPGLGSPSVSYTKQDFAVASGDSEISCPLVPGNMEPGESGVMTGNMPVRQGIVRIKTEAPVASFRVTSIVGEDTETNDVILYRGDVATAITLTGSPKYDLCYRFVSDMPLNEIDINVNAGAAVQCSVEVVGGN
jgi:hypothetical protein